MTGFKKYLIESAGYDWNGFRLPANFIKNDKGKARYLKAIDAFQKGIADKHIWNADFKDLYSYDFSRNYEDSLDVTLSKVYLAMDDETRRKYDVVYWANKSPVGIKKSFKEVAPFKNEFPDGYAILAAMQTFPDMLKELKGYIEKGRKVSDEQKETKAKFAATMSSSAAKEIEQVLHKTIDGIRADYEKSFEQHLTKKIEYYLSQKDEILAKHAKDRFFNKKHWWSALEDRILMQDVMDYETGELDKNWKAKVAEQAKKQVKYILDGFVEKNKRKLGSIVDKKRNLAGIKIISNRIHQGNLDNVLLFTFKDASQFTVYSKTIYKYSPRGKLFTQYPTRFKGVKLSTGATLAGATEESMNKLFH